MSLGLLGGGGFGCGCVECSRASFMGYITEQNSYAQAQASQSQYVAMMNAAAQQYHPPVRKPAEWETGWFESQSEWEKMP